MTTNLLPLTVQAGGFNPPASPGKETHHDHADN